MLVREACGQALSSEPAAAQRPLQLGRQPRRDEMPRHVEAAHSERPPRPELAEGLPRCPLCGEAAGQELEAHVWARHGQLLGAPGGDIGNDEQLYECPMCSLTCTNIQILEEHVDLHLEEHSFSEVLSLWNVAAWLGGNVRDLELAQWLQTEEDKRQRSEEEKREREEFKKLQRQYGLDNSGGYKQQFLKNMEREVDRGKMQPFEYHKRKADMMECLAFGIDDGKTKTSGIIEALCKYYQNENKDVRHVWLSAGVDHFHSSLGDRGWGCGYRNFQMLLSSLLQNSLYNDCLRDTTSIPSIPKIQSMIEDAWREGFDPHGASHFNNRLHGSKAWIGACEIYSLLTNLRIKCQIIDFHKPTGPTGTHPRLFEWILRYYSSDSEGGGKVACTSKPPIYLQHQGHSRTIVGIEEKKNRTLCLLLFDPGCPSQEMQKLLKQNNDGTSLKLLRKFVGSLKEKQYQIVAVDGVLSLEEKIARCHASQVLTSEKIP
ncbi:PREDICTED: zinc finger with UFM1-specific peptidase domain protein isoform X2 [Calidris pugnax]|uniref:zinc finger with UFM1-specific peptidase domain protein isoform X2 n=1 Tax=Calidris pugnax TaxID=198806 RepID=UPI00071CE8D6|nr:PREDICTED: zinc finger with UFM1-specific peptidase domain protein isoform X2 [Calidris pugnax]